MKRIIALIMVAVMCLSLFAGCGSKSKGGLPKNIEIQLPASAGGGTDVFVRTLTNWVNTNYKDHNFTVINNNDGGGVVAYETVRTAKGDGSKILFFHGSMLIKTATGIYEHSAAEDFKVIGVCQSAEKGGYVLVVNSESGITNVEEFIAAAKSNGNFKIGIETGGGSHLQAGMLATGLGIPLNYVEAGPDTEKLTALVGGSIECALVNANQAKQYIEAGKINAIACFSATDEGGRCSNLPDVPSFTELGYPLVYSSPFFILGPKDMSDETAQAIREMFAAAAVAPEVIEILTNSGMVNTFVPYEEGAGIIKARQTNLNSVCEMLGLKQK